MRIAVVGATGAVGIECLQLLDKKIVLAAHVVPVASGRSAGRDLGSELGLSVPIDPVQDLAAIDPRGVDAAVFCAGAEISRRHAERFAAAGALVVDNSSAFRMRPDVPLVVPQVNPATLATRPPANLIANPNCSTIQLVRVLHPLSKIADIEQVVVSTYQAASGGGLTGLAELTATSRDVLDGRRSAEAGKFGAPLAFNLVPQIGAFDDDGRTHEESKLAREPRKILGSPTLRVTATAVRVPVFHCHSEAVYLRTAEPITVAEAEEALSTAPAIRLYPATAAAPYPLPRNVAATDEGRWEVHVGRVRTDPQDPRGLWLWVVADNLTVGAALNALEILGVAADYGWLR